MRELIYHAREECGASSAEFALVLIPFIGLVFGIIGLCLLLYANQTLQFATQSAARYYSVQCANGSNPTVAQVRSYAESVYKGPSISPTFTPVSGGCASNSHEVSVSGNFILNAGIFSKSLLLQAHANFP